MPKHTTERAKRAANVNFCNKRICCIIGSLTSLVKNKDMETESIVLLSQAKFLLVRSLENWDLVYYPKLDRKKKTREVKLDE